MTSSSSLVYLGKYYDQGKKFDNNLFKHPAQFCNIKRIRTSLHHPQTNGKTERMNQTIMNMLKTLAEKNKSNWKDNIQKLVHVFNFKTHFSTAIHHTTCYLVVHQNSPHRFDNIIFSS